MSEEKLKCSTKGCGATITQNVYDYSMKTFKRPLCYPCQDKIRGKEDSWGYKRPGESEEDKGIVDVSETSEDKTQEDTELKAEARKVDNETIRLVTDMDRDDKEKFYAWLKQKYGVDDLEPLNIDQKREVLEQTKTAVQKRDEEKGEGADVKQDAEVKQEEDPNQPGQQEEKKIKIDWDNIPVQVLIPKLRKALEYQTIDDNGYTVKHTSGNHSVHKTTLDSCDCSDYVHRGTSINPCTHQVRIKYSDEEIREKLKGVGAEELPVTRKEQQEIMPFSERDTHSDMCISDITPRLAEIGKIKIGRKSEKEVHGHLLPEKWDHFEIATLVKDNEGRLIMDKEMNAKIGEGCKTLDVELCYDNPSMNMPNFYALLSEGKIMCRGNGVVATKTLDESKEEIVCNPKTCEAYQKKKCKHRGRLSVILSASNRLGGVYVFRTSGFNSIRNIMSSMGFLRGITGGVLGGIPLHLTLLPMTVKPQGVNQNVKIYAANLEYAGSPSELKKAAVEEIQRRMQLGIDMGQTEKADVELLKAQMMEEAEEEAKAEEFIPEGE